MSIKSKIAGGIATGVVIAATILPAGAFASTVTVHGNGVGSSNTVVLSNSNTSSTKQVNKTAVVNLTGVFQNTGNNKANGNTGGGAVSVTSGSAMSTVTNTTTAGANINTSPCGCVSAPDDSVTISGNGKNSSNTVVLGSSNSSFTTQVNKTLVVNGTFVLQNTGGNTANGNTGGGAVSVTSGGATSSVTNTTTAGLNSM